MTISFEAGTLADHRAPDGTTLPVLVPIWVRNGTGSAAQTLYKAETIRLRGTAEGGGTALTTNIFVKPGTLGSLDVSNPPDSTIAGTDFGPGTAITVTAYDQYRNRKNDLVGNLYFESSDPKALIAWNVNHPYVFTLADGGIHTFDGEGFEFRTTGFHTFDAVIGNVRRTSRPFNVLPGRIKTFTFDVVTTQTAGQPFELKVVNAVDDFGNPADALIQINLPSGDHNAPNGHAPTLTPITVRKGKGSSYQTLVRAESLQLLGQAVGATGVSALTPIIIVQPGALASFKFFDVPATIPTNTFFPSTVTVRAYDVYDNVKTNFTGTVSFFSSDPSPQKVLPAPTSFSGSNGTRTFPGTNFKLITLGEQYIWATFGTVSDSTRIIRVTGPNNIRITRIVADDSTVSQGQNGLVVRMELVNNSDDAFENFTASLNFRAGVLSVNGDYSAPAVTGSIPARGSMSLTFTVNVAANATLGAITLDGQILGTYKGVPAQANNAEITDQWLVQRPAALQAAALNIQADSLARGGGGIPVTIFVRNNEGILNTADALAGAATFSFFNEQLVDVSSNFIITPDPAQPRPVRVLGGATAQLRYFLSSTPNAPLGRITVAARVDYQDANTKGLRTTNVSPSDQFTSIDAPSLQIVGIVPTQPAVTQGQTKPFTITVGVKNLSTSPVTLNFQPDRTKIQFLKSGLSGSPDISVTSPTRLRSGSQAIQAGEIGYLDYTVTRIGSGVPSGNYTIFARVESSDGYFTNSNISGSYGALEVQTPDDVVIARVFPSQSSATVNSSERTWNIVIELSNRGGSPVTIDLNAVQAGMTDQAGQPVSNFTFGQATLANGDAVLSERETDILTLPVTRTGRPAGVVTINPQIRYTVNNTGEVKSKSAGDAKSSILLQNPSDLRISEIKSRLPQISSGRETTWDVFVVVENRGEAAVEVNPASVDSTWLRFYLGSTPSNAFSVTKPDALFGSKSKTLNGGAKDSLLFKVMARVNTPAVYDVRAAVKAIELNRRLPRYAENQQPVQLAVVSAADIAYQPNSLGPLTAIPGRSVEFQLSVVNNGQAAVTLFSDATTFSFSDGVNTYSANLDETRGTVIPGNGTVRLYFQQRYLTSAFALGAYEPVLVLSGIENGTAFLKTITLAGTSIRISQPGNISVDLVVPSAKTVTAGQTQPWQIDVQVTNNSGGTLKLKSAAMIFSFGTQNVSNRFGVNSPDKFVDNSPFIGNGRSKVIRFNVNSVSEDAPLGDVLLSAKAVLSDSLESGPLFEQQISNAAKVTVQSPAILEVLALKSQQSTLTRGQTEPVEVTAHLRNRGGSNLSLVQDPAMTFLTFSKGNENFTVQTPNIFVGSGSSILAGNTQDSVRFRITKVAAAPEMVGETTINANLALREDNTGRYLTNIAPEQLRITIQDSAKVRLDSLEAMINSGGFVNSGQEFFLRAKVTHVGGENSDYIKQARVQFYSDNGLFALPDGSTASVTNLAPGTSAWTPPVRVAPPNIQGQKGLFRATIVSATARNTNGPARIVHPSVDSTETVFTQAPAQFAVVQIRVDQDTVTSSSVIPWNIFVTVRNNGAGVIELLDPAASDIKIFNESGVEETDHLIEPQPIPAGQRRISNGASVTLTYTVRETGKGAGRKTVRAAIRGLELNNLAGGPRIVTADTQIFVTSSSVVRLVSTFIDTTHNVDKNGVGHVNVGQEFVVRVQVRNEGGRFIDTVRVALTAPNSTVLTPERTITRLNIAATGDVGFRIKAAELENLDGEILTARILSAKGFDGSQANIKEAVDATAEIKIYRPAALRIVSTKNMAPNPSREVSFGQEFTVRVRVRNEGSESAGQALVSLTPDKTNLADVAQSPLYIPTTIAGGESAEIDFRIQAGSTLGEVVFRSALLSATGLNSKQNVSILSADGADTTKAIIRRGANLEIVQVQSSVETVNAGDRLSPWNIFVIVRNTGDAALQFIAVSDSNVTFTVGGIVDRDYKVLPPDGLEQAKNFVLAAGATDTLVYTVRRNGDLAGQAVYTVYLRAFDMNSSGELRLSAVKSGNIYVANNASLVIRQTTAEVKAEDNNNTALVNRGQQFIVQVHIQTGQFGGVQDVVVKLESSGNSLRTALYDTIRSIGSDSVAVAKFLIRADDSWDERLGEKIEVFRARILSAVAKGDLTAVTPREPARGADEVRVRIQTPAQLSYRLQIGDLGGTWVEKGKPFTVVAKLRNFGKAGIGVGRLEVTPPKGYLIEREPRNFIAEPVEKAFSLPAGTDSLDLRFVLRAPETISGPDRIESRLTLIPPDLNTGLQALLGDIRSFVDVRTDTVGALTIQSFVVEGPKGAVDGILSTEQVLHLMAVVKSSQNIVDRQATLSLPRLPVTPGYEFKSDQVILITQEVDTLRWELTAPLYPVADAHAFTLSVTGGNPADTLYFDTRQLVIQKVEQRTTLALEPIEIYPQGVIRQGIANFTQGQQARIVTRVRNFGQAPYVGNGTVTLDLSRSGGLVLTGGDSPSKAFTGDEEISWSVQAPSIVDGTQRQIIVRITMIPQDANTGTAARVTTTERILPCIYNRGGSITIDSIFLRTIFGEPISAVSTEQEFQVAAQISTFGVKDAEIKTTLYVTSPQFRILDAVKFLPGSGEKLWQTWTVTAPTAIPSTPDSCYIKVEAIDLQSEQPISRQSGKIALPLTQRSIFTVEPTISFPPESSTKDKVSTDQIFYLTAVIKHSGAGFNQSDKFRMRLSVPPGFRLLEGETEVKEVSAADYAAKNLHPTWQLRAPSRGSDLLSRFAIFVDGLPRDINSGLPSKTDKDEVIFPLRTVEKARVKLSLYVHDTPGNDSTSVRPGSIFKVTSWLENFGEAQIVGNYRLRLQVPEIFQLVDLDTLKSANKDTVSWRIRAPRAVTSRPDSLVVSLLDLPLDEFARTPVELIDGDSSAVAKVWVEPGKVMIKPFTVRKQTTVVRGASNVPMMGLALKNMESSATVRSYVTGITVTVRDRSGKKISGKSVIRRIAAVKADQDDYLFGQAVAFEDSGGVFLNFRSFVMDTLIGSKTDSIKLIVDLREQAELIDFHLSIDSTSAVKIVDEFSVPVMLVDSTGAAYSYLGFVSHPAVLVDASLGKSFYNYPNPFGRLSKPKTSFVYYLKEASDIKLSIYTLTGDLVRTWEFKKDEYPDYTSPGLHQGDIEWDGTNGMGVPVLNGVYLAYLKTGYGEQTVTKIAVVR
ncbi:MAG: hypothetical protein ONB12_02330 [candidate division KSB1 bacterium]|nr:hypothetical protein [candidate division KSB1 bacterium]